MKRKYVLIVLLTGMFLTQVQAESLSLRMKMQKPVDYSHAGIILAVPTGFSYSPQLTQEFQILLASRIEGRQATQSVSLAAYPVEADTTVKGFLEDLRKPMESNLAVRQLKVNKTIKEVIGGIEGASTHLTYSFRGIETAAISACFLRDVLPLAPASKSSTQPQGHRIAYVLTLEVAAEHQNILQRTFEAIVRSIMITMVERPIDLEIDYDGGYLRHFSQGYALRMPKQWVGGINDLGAFTEQADYKLGGLPCPSVQVVSNLVPATMTAEACGTKAIDFMKKNGTKVEILSKGPAKMAKRDGYQFVLRKTVAPSTNPADAPAPATTTLEVHRLLCVPAAADAYEPRPRNYTMIVAGQNVSPEQLTKVADNLAERFLVIPIREE